MIKQASFPSDTKPKALPKTAVGALYNFPTGYQIFQETLIEWRKIENETASKRTFGAEISLMDLQSYKNGTALPWSLFIEPTLITSESGINYTSSMITEQRADDVVRSARNKAMLFPVSQMSALSIRVLDLLKQTLSDKGGLPNLPAMNFVEAPDESVLLEWVFPNWRIGFSIEPKLEESGWFFSSDKSAGSMIVGGELRDFNATWLLDWVFTHLKTSISHA